MTDNTNIAERAQAHADVLRQYGTQQSGWVKVHTSDLVAYGEFLHQLSVALRSEEWQPIATAEEPQHSGRSCSTTANGGRPSGSADGMNTNGHGA